MATCIYRSPLAFRIQAFQDTRRLVGGRGLAERKILRYLDRFLMSELKAGQAITREIAEKWNNSMSNLSPNTRINRLSVLRQFCRYLSYFDPRTCIVHRSFVPVRTRQMPYIYTKKEIKQILVAAKRIGPSNSLRPEVVSTLLGLLYSTGLRIGEALKLTIGDIDLKKQVILVRETKFKKSRYVPISSSVVNSLRKFLEKRSRAGFATAKDALVFVNRNGKSFGQSTIATIFLEIVRKLGIRGPMGTRGPRIHDFRHSFAVSRLVAWYKDGSNVMAKLPLLSTYLGHTTVSSTEVYLHATTELLEQVGRRFHSSFAVPPRNKERDHGKN
jgi:integrase/recombinase XerD